MFNCYVWFFSDFDIFLDLEMSDESPNRDDVREIGRWLPDGSAQGIPGLGMTNSLRTGKLPLIDIYKDLPIENGDFP